MPNIRNAIEQRVHGENNIKSESYEQHP